MKIAKKTNKEWVANTARDYECMIELYFLKNDIYTLNQALAIPEEIKCYNKFRYNQQV